MFATEALERSMSKACVSGFSNWARTGRILAGGALLHVLLALLLTTPAHAASTRDYIYDPAGRLSKVMDADGSLIAYTYDAVGNITKIGRSTVDPTFNILGSSPTTGGAGDLVTIQGHGFDSNLAGNTVTIGGVTATVVSVGPNGRSLVVKVPWGAETGDISVTASGKTTVAPEKFTVFKYGDVGLRGTLISGDTASYPLELKQGQYVQIRLVDASHNAFYPKVVLNDATGTAVSSAQGADVAAIGYSAATSGTYQMVLSDASGQKIAGDYVLYYAVAPGSNEGGLLKPDTPVDGVIDLGDLDSYTFDATAGAAVILRVVDVAQGSFAPYVQVFDPNGALVTSATNGIVAAVSLTPTVSGTYTVLVFDNSSGYASSGNYKVYYTRAPGSNNGGTLDPNVPIDGAIDLGEVDAYTFDLTAGVSARLTVADVGQNSLVPYLQIYDPNGNLVTSANNGIVAAVSLTASVAGKYTAVVFDYSANYGSTGTYKIYYSKAPGSNDGGALDPNTPSDGTIDLGDMDAYTFDVTAGANVRLDVADVGQSSFVPYVQVFDPNGKLVTSAYNGIVAAVSLTASVAGKYTALVFDYSANYGSTGTYKIYYSKAPGSNDGGALDPNTPVTGTIDLGDIDAYTFDISAGTSVQMRVADVAQTGLTPYVQIYDPNGGLLTSNYGANVAAVSLTATITGKYTAFVFDYSANYGSTGDYKIYYAIAPGSNEGGALNPNTPVDGTIDLGDIDAYTFDVTSGVGIQLRVTNAAQAAFTPYIQVYDPNGKLVIGAYGASVAAVSLTPTVSGTYTAFVFDYSSGYAGSGAYKIYYARAPGSNDGGVLAPNAPIAGTIDLGDVDAYTFDATVGTSVQLRVTNAAHAAFTPYIQVYDPNGSLVIGGYGASVAAVSLTASVAGTYTAFVFDYSSGYAGSGAYEIYYTRAPGSNDGGVLDPDSPIAGTIDLGDLDAYTFDAAVGTSVLLRVANVAQAAFTPYVQVYDPNGKLVTGAYGASVAAVSFVTAIAGTYTAFVYDYSSGYAGSGAYKIYYAKAPGSNEGGALTASVAATGTIDLGDLDTYTISAKVGDKFKVVTTDVDASAFTPYEAIYGPTGANVTGTYGADTASTTFIATTAGTYTVVLFDYSSGYGSSGNYSLLVTPN